MVGTFDERESQDSLFSRIQTNSYDPKLTHAFRPALLQWTRFNQLMRASTGVMMSASSCGMDVPGEHEI